MVKGSTFVRGTFRDLMCRTGDGKPYLLAASLRIDRSGPMIRLIVAGNSPFPQLPFFLFASSDRNSNTSAFDISSSRQSPNLGVKWLSMFLRTTSMLLCRHPTAHSTNQISVNSRKMGIDFCACETLRSISLNRAILGEFGY